MKDNKLKYIIWYVILLGSAFPKYETANYENSINRLLEKLYFSEGFAEKRILYRSNGVNKTGLLKENKALARSHFSPNLTDFYADTMSRFTDYLSRKISKNSETPAMPPNNAEGPPASPLLFSLSAIPPINNKTLANLSMAEIKNVGVINGTLTNELMGSSSKKCSNNKTERLEKNPSLMEAIFNPFFLKVFKSNDSAIRKTKTNPGKSNKSTKQSKQSNASYARDSDVMHKLIKNTPYKYTDEEFLLGNKPPPVVYSKLSPDNFESSYYRLKEATGRRFKIFNKNAVGGRKGNKENANKSRWPGHQWRNREGKIISKPVGLVDMVKSDNSIGDLLNQTLLNFGSQIYNLLQEEVTANEEGRVTSNKFWSNIKRKFTGLEDSNHNNFAYELIKNGGGSKQRWRELSSSGQFCV